MNRREFLSAGAASIGAVAVGGCSESRLAAWSPAKHAPVDWGSLAGQFDHPARPINFVGFFLASVPRVVRAAVDEHRRELERDAAGYWIAHHVEFEDRVRAAAARYLGVDGPDEIALTDSTTMGLGVLYSGIRMRPDQEILSSVHDHWATSGTLDARVKRHGGRDVRRIALYENPAQASADEIVKRIRAAVTPATRLLALTWVHSVSGVKLPIARIAEVVTEANRGRGIDDRLLFCVDGVHGLGIDDVTLPQLGCDFFSAGTHKWMLGPRGTGILWGRKELWSQVDPIFSSFSGASGAGQTHTPGGFHTFEARWAADQAFEFHLALGKARVAQRLRSINEQIREGLAGIPRVKLHTPRDWGLSAGLTCFDVDGLEPGEVVQRLADRGITASKSPYEICTARVAGCLWNTPSDVDALLREVRNLRA